MVFFSVPKIDRCTIDMQRIPGEVVGGDKVKFYKVATSAGIIKQTFHFHFCLHWRCQSQQE